MKILILFLSVLTAAAQTPTLKNFNRQHFLITNNGATTNIIKTRLSSTNFDFNTFNITNIGGPTYNTTINGPVTVNTNITFTSNTFFTSNSVTYFAGPIYYITTNGVTNLLNPIPVWTNDVSSGVVSVVNPYNYVFVTDIFNNGWDVLFSKPVVLTNGTNIVRSDLHSGLIIAGTTTNASDSIIQLKAGYFQGQSLKIISFNTPNVFTLKNGMAVDGSPGGVNILNGDWVGGTNLVLTLTYDGLNWKEDGRYVQGGAPPMFGTNYWTNIAGVLQPVDLTLPVEIDSQIIFGPGSTNSLRRSGRDLYYTNSVTSGGSVFGFRLVSGLGQPFEASFLGGGNGSAYVTGFNTAALREANGSTAAYWSSGRFWPQQTGSILGGSGDGSTTPATPWAEVNQEHSYHYGFYSGVNNYSRLSTLHTGTNGVVVLDSQAIGSAGLARPINLQIGSTNMLSIDGLSGASTTGMLLYENGVAQRVTIGAADSGGVGYRVLRIPN